MPPIRTRLTAAAGTVTLAAVLAACSSTGGSAPTPTARPASASFDSQAADQALKKAVNGYLRSYYANNPDAAYEFLSAHCQSLVSASEFTLQVARITEQVRGGGLRAQDLESVNTGPNGATVTYSAGPTGDRDDRSEQWVPENGSWRNNTC